ncbi:MAG TPA: S1-like domain-containing RNA-binding protein [Bdellovibrionota bacterium]|nr:S1-like domain-containing RNA-binding protein [Bdellovibrionota bacterium]
MLGIGKLNRLKVTRRVDFGLYLDGKESGEILLPTRYVPKNCNPGDALEVFIYYDSSDRLIATTDAPRAKVGEFARLKVVGVEAVGAFLDWGLSKDLLLPFAEQTSRPRMGEEVLVYIYLDNSNRICASMKLEKHLESAQGIFREGQGVDLWIGAKTDLGYTAIIAKHYLGLLYDNEIFQPLKPGQRLRGYIKKMRADGKIDLTLQKTGHKAASEIGTKILTVLKEKNGFLAINDKTPPETVYDLFGVSKKKFKAALGGLYKKRLIIIGEDGIRLAFHGS